MIQMGDPEDHATSNCKKWDLVGLIEQCFFVNDE